MSNCCCYAVADWLGGQGSAGSRGRGSNNEKGILILLCSLAQAWSKIIDVCVDLGVPSGIMCTCG